MKSNPLYIKYLHENSNWYKILIRDPFMINNFIDEVKTSYGLYTTDKLSKALSNFEMITSIIKNMI